MHVIKSVVEPSTTICKFINANEATQHRSDFSSTDSALQVSLRLLSNNVKVPPHAHMQVEKKYEIQNESWFIFSGKVLALIYDLNDELLSKLTLSAGDLIVFYNGGHSLEVLVDNTIFIEHKSGPYLGAENDKRNF
jgi:cupin fold WbuC family metalloprotein